MAGQRREKKQLRPVFNFPVPPEGWDAAYGEAEGERIARFILEWSGLDWDDVFGNRARNRRAQEGVEHKLAELRSEHEREQELRLNGHEPSRWQAAAAFVEEDIVAHPAAYPAHYRLPDGSLNPRLERPAADLVLKRIEALHKKPL